MLISNFKNPPGNFSRLFLRLKLVAQVESGLSLDCRHNLSLERGERKEGRRTGDGSGGEAPAELSLHKKPLNKILHKFELSRETQGLSAKARSKKLHIAIHAYGQVITC